MNSGRWYTIAILMMLVAAPSLASAATNRVLNDDCEQAGPLPTSIPHWTDDDANTVTARVEALGVGQSAACVVQGAGVLRSADLFAVIPGETLTFSFEAWEMRTEPTTDVCDLFFGPCEPQSSGTVAGDGVGAIVFYNSIGHARGTVAMGIDSFAETYVLYVNSGVIVPSEATYAQVLLGGSLALDVIDPLVFGIGLSSPTTLTAFDNVFVG